jgi:two-component system cell cycle sensor histidine kinase/response regulator CckA
VEKELYEELLDAIDGALILFEADTSGTSLRLVFANRKARALFGQAIAAEPGRRLEAALPGFGEQEVASCFEALRARQPRTLGSHRAARHGAFVKRAVPLEANRLLIVFEPTLDDAAVERLGDAHRFLDAVIEDLPAMVFVKDAETLRFVRFNKAGEELLGASRADLLGKSDYDFFPEDQADFFVQKDRDVLSRRVLLDIPEEPIDTHRGQRWLHTRKIPILDERGEPRLLLGVSIDITEEKHARDLMRDSRDALARDVAVRTNELMTEVGTRQRAELALAEIEEQLRQAQKMEAIGRLAGGVAHDFNNLLSVILSYSELAERALERGQALSEEIQQIRHAAERAGELTRQLLAFSRRQVLEPKVVALNDAIRRLDGMLRRIIGEHIEFRTLCARQLGMVKVDPTQIEQVIMNLVVNACDAMPKGGRLTIETANVTLDDEYARDHVGAAAGEHVMLAVTDTGMGMDRATQSRIFEPFFTTKGPGKGTGLGLSTVFGIVKQSGGNIYVYSEPGRGATFKVYLPRTDAPLVTPESRPPSSIKRGSETILLVEDDDQVRRVVSGVLSRNGYRVLQAANAREALALADDFPNQIHLLLTDLVLPRMSGTELAQQIQTRRTGVRVLCMSGYTDDAAYGSGLLETGMAFLQKPLTPDSLLRKVREVLH